MNTNTIKKTVSKLAITLLAITANACSAKSEWIKVIQTETSVHYYLDKSDNVPHDDILYTSMISIYRYPEIVNVVVTSMVKTYATFLV